MARSSPTELEHCVLGVVWRDGPCSAYAVQREFARSVSSTWSASAGSIYPVIRRLERLGLVRARTMVWGTRGKREFVATAKGKRTLTAWIEHLPDWTGKPTIDPIRTRTNFLEALKSRKAQLRFVTRAAATTRAQFPALRREAAQSRKEPSPVRYLKAISALYELQARLRWLREAQRALGR